MTVESDYNEGSPRAPYPPAPQGSSAFPGAGSAGAETRSGFRAIGVAVSKVAAPLVKKRGGGLLARIKADWGAIVGETWSQVTWPAALGRDGALKLRVLSVAALDLQHRAPLVIERVNLYFGRPVATRLMIVQGPLPLTPAPAAPPASPLAAGATDVLDKHLAGISDPDLRAALARLGRAVAAAEAEAAREAVASETRRD
jgi:hypothetical protein